MVGRGETGRSDCVGILIDKWDKFWACGDCKLIGLPVRCHYLTESLTARPIHLTKTY